MDFIWYKPDLGCIKGVILYLHGTIFGKISMPSANTQSIRAIGGLYSSQGYCVVFPDLLGYNMQYPNEPHSYMTSYEQNIMSSVLALNKFY